MGNTTYMLTTIDNPYNPFTQFDLWQQYDHDKGYYTTEYLARIAYTSPELSDADQDLAIDLAIDEIIEYNVLGIYKRVYANDSDSTSGSVINDDASESESIESQASNTIEE